MTNQIKTLPPPGVRTRGLANLFSTHPAMQERIRRLRATLCARTA